MQLFKLCSVSQTQTSTFPSTKNKKGGFGVEAGRGYSSSVSPAGSDGAGWDAAQSSFSLERRCSCDFWPSKVSRQHCIFSSDGSQDGQIMRSQPSQSQRMHCVRLGDRHWDWEHGQPRDWLFTATPHQCRKLTFHVGQKQLPRIHKRTKSAPFLI